jgi:hypothetical protein
MPSATTLCPLFVPPGCSHSSCHLQGVRAPGILPHPLMPLGTHFPLHWVPVGPLLTQDRADLTSHKAFSGEALGPRPTWPVYVHYNQEEEG